MKLLLIGPNGLKKIIAKANAAKIRVKTDATLNFDGLTAFCSVKLCSIYFCRFSFVGLGKPK